MLTSDHKSLIKATVPVLKENGVLLTDHFYKRMFRHNPELKNVFNQGNQQNGRQQTALAMAVLAYAEHIENPGVLMPAIDAIGQKHTSLDIRPEHYLIVGKHLLASISEVLGEAATPDILEAWRLAYLQLAQIMSGHEANMYSAQVEKPGGWTGWRPFVVKEKVQESSEITSFYLYPADGGAIADFVPGQYISGRVFVPELNLLQPRQYSLSSAPNGTFYRISVKREASLENPDGWVSNHLHQSVEQGAIIEVSAPAGNFTLQNNDDRPVVFISGGVGQTPLMSMLQRLIDTNSSRAKTWIHGCRSAEVHAFRETLDDWSGSHPALEQVIFYDQPKTAGGHVRAGWVDLNAVEPAILRADADYYICGPAAFITKHYQALLDKGIGKEAIFYEEFGPQTLSLN